MTPSSRSRHGQRRHSAITQAVEESVGMALSLDKVRDFSRHKNIGTLMV
jgi:hypothetical protein